jgi:electron transport complex protein RnfG
MLVASISKNSLLLFLFAVVTAGLLAFTYVNTKSTIVAAERQAAKRALQEIVSANRIDNDLMVDAIEVPVAALEILGLSKESNDKHTIAIGKKNNHIIAIIVPAIAPDGYGGEIKLLVGVNSDGSVAGVRVLAHQETPGLGDKVDLKRSDWILSFNQRSLSNPLPAKWKVKKDGGKFDQFTGATITPRAIVKQVYNVLTVVRDYHPLLFSTEKPQ